MGIAGCTQEFKAQEMYMAFSGLRTCAAVNPEACGVLAQLAAKLGSCRQKLRTKHLQAIFFIIRSVSSAFDTRNALLAACLKHVKSAMQNGTSSDSTTMCI